MVDSGVKKYGTTSSEKDAEDTLKCRQIVREIMTFGVNQAQVMKIICLLALELENRDHLQQISDLVKRLEAGDSKKSTLILK